jgi:hypothetical protein
VLLAVGAGTTAGGPIPVGAAGGAELYKRDDRGDIVRTRMDETLLHKLAGSGGGAAFRITQGEAAVAAVRREVGRLQKREMEVRSFSEYDSYFQWFLLPAFLLLVLEAWLSWRKKNIKALFGLLLAGSFSLPAQTRMNYRAKATGTTSGQITAKPKRHTAGLPKSNLAIRTLRTTPAMPFTNRATMPSRNTILNERPRLPKTRPCGRMPCTTWATPT